MVTRPGARPPIAAGAHVLVRDAVWRVVQVDPTSTGKAVRVVGVSEVVRDREAVFLDDYEPSIEVLDPAETRLVADPSSGHHAALLYVESLLREVPPPDAAVRIGHRGALDVLPFQLEPARLALAQLRPRLLIADAVGLGKTLEAGILLAELIRRGRARRILVVTVKSVLAQFQKELWSRFTIPLVRLDSVGLKRVRERIPTNHNPFHHFDRVIVSMDTLKQNNVFRTHLEKSHWDVIVIDEAHNVAERGADLTLRARLATLLAHRSDALILLTATPHDGRPRSVASLMNMLDETAIANPDDYRREDIEGLFVRRFKHHVADQVKAHFPEREVAYARAEATPAEEEAFRVLERLQHSPLNKKQGAMLFRTALEKALLSSPAACLQTLDTRLGNLRRDPTERAADVALLEELRDAVAAIGPDQFSRYQRLLALLREATGHWAWRPARDDRLVIFTERIETLNFLAERLRADLRLPDQAVAVLHGAMSDVEQAAVVQDFGSAGRPVRLLVCSDVASEGINLHFLCHRMIHFDLPWSLMVFQQRNGRVDRYGQERVPLIQYLQLETKNERLRGEVRILEVLAKKDAAAAANIDDPSALAGAEDVDTQVAQTAQAIEEGVSEEAFASLLSLVGDVDALLPPTRPAAPASAPAALPSLYPSDFEALRAALDLFRQDEPIRAEIRPADGYLEFDAPADLRRRYRALPPEALGDGTLSLTASVDRMQRSIRDARLDDESWPRQQYLWPLHPVFSWVADRVRLRFGRHSAPVISLPGRLAPDERVCLVSGLVPNRQAQPILHRWYGAVFRASKLERLEALESVLERTQLGREPAPNAGPPPDLAALQRLVPEAVRVVRERVVDDRRALDADLQRRLDLQLDRLARLRERKVRQLSVEFAGAVGQGAERRDEARRRVDEVFDRFVEWAHAALTTEPHPFVQLVAVLRGGP